MNQLNGGAYERRLEPESSGGNEVYKPNRTRNSEAQSSHNRRSEASHCSRNSHPSNQGLGRSKDSPFAAKEVDVDVGDRFSNSSYKSHNRWRNESDSTRNSNHSYGRYSRVSRDPGRRSPTATRRLSQDRSKFDSREYRRHQKRRQSRSPSASQDKKRRLSNSRFISHESQKMYPNQRSLSLDLRGSNKTSRDHSCSRTESVTDQRKNQPRSQKAATTDQTNRRPGDNNRISNQAKRINGVRCREYYEKGLCLRGDQCQYDHGENPVVLEDMASWPSSSPIGPCSSGQKKHMNGYNTPYHSKVRPMPSSSYPASSQCTDSKRSARQAKESSTTDRTTLTNGQMDYALAFQLFRDVDEEGSSESEDEIPAWIRSAPDELYYEKQSTGEVLASSRAIKVISKFETTLVNFAMERRLQAETLGAQKMEELNKTSQRKISHDSDVESGEASSESSSSSDSEDDKQTATRSDKANQELNRRMLHPRRLHKELWHNDPGLMNDGPVCRCSPRARRFGIRHGFYPGEQGPTVSCHKYGSNSATLFHYRVVVHPLKNFVVDKPTIILFDGHDYNFEGFSILSHHPLELRDLPPCSVIRFNIRYDISLIQEKRLESFCVAELDIFTKYLFTELLELVDLKLNGDGDNCPMFHVFPRFIRKLPGNGKELLPISRVLQYLLKNDKDILQERDLKNFHDLDSKNWQKFADRHKGTIVTKWGMKPAAVRVDQVDRNVDDQEHDPSLGIPFPVIVHFGIRPPQLSYAGNSDYQRCWRQYVKYRHLLSNMPKPSSEDRRKLTVKEIKLQEMRTKSSMKRDVTVAVSCKGFRTTGLCCDIVQHALLIPVLIGHLRFHRSLVQLEEKIGYRFNTRYLLQLALTHPSYRENFGTNSDHARNALTNCGIRQPEYGDRMIHYDTTRKRGINTLISIMSKFGESKETQSGITHNERLEFLGDAVVEFITSIHLFHLFPDLEEGGLATYRAAIVQNQHLALLAQKLGLDQFMLYAHGSDLCHDSELRHAMANSLEALLGAIFLDGGIEVADRIFAHTLFQDDEPELLYCWVNYPKHPLQSQEPIGDRQWVTTHSVLEKLVSFEDSIGVRFTHIRLLARAFTDRSLGYTNLTCGSNQRLEFLGDTVLQLISSEYLYRFFPEHHEGHLSLLRSSLVNNRTQALVCDELGMAKFVMRSDPKAELKTKDRADLLEAFLGALYIDRGLAHCITFCRVCFIPRLTNSILSQEWNDPKSKLQQCCLTLRTMNGREPDIPVYKVIESLGPTNTRIYMVAVYFRGKRLACGGGHSIQDAEMCAAASALEQCGKLFPQLKHQKRVMKRSTRHGPQPKHQR